MAKDFNGKVVLITGASRGVGASSAKKIAARGGDVIVNYRSKASRAEAVADYVQEQGGKAYLAQADLVVNSDLDAMFGSLDTQIEKIDILILNASGGLEKGAAEDYALSLNRDAQLRLAQLALPRMAQGGRIVFVTSHPAHFFGSYISYDDYDIVAASKHAGEQVLRAEIANFTRVGVDLVVVSGDLIEGTITAKLLERSNKGMTENRREAVGSLPTIDDFAEAIVNAAVDSKLASGDTVYVGSTD
jgi:3-oxoacyl-[acyl-carrier protein] reductase